MAKEETLFDKIISGDIPCYKVYEDEHVFSFLDIAPQSLGHTLVVPKESKAYVHELSDDAAAAIGRALPRICRAVMAASGSSAYNLLQNNGSEAGQSVFHVHFHIIPCFETKRLDFNWAPTNLTPDNAAVLVAKIDKFLSDEV